MPIQTFFLTGELTYFTENYVDYVFKIRMYLNKNSNEYSLSSYQNVFAKNKIYSTLEFFTKP